MRVSVVLFRKKKGQKAEKATEDSELELRVKVETERIMAPSRAVAERERGIGWGGAGIACGSPRPCAKVATGGATR